ncbi:N-acetylglucosamine-6-phosphate deacetylase [Spiroplasma turonicum]|uniref:N-acetylglucosamine-6-phosphate deacetylase n=1 Tax=Spiroplasma turonicum TaxID=216946 RepID=A0A0K1P635_9MOLU|nr:N-acetylglucosamine-6-phosphate deacetylase [Spiroplasma turonicum]AKU79639.1 N-acetylglucosamine-6-phosphate deacetylase [Spiroplasma turonicum]ALX70660.1 N-acetylglucosamine-6-phosphate deacetylase [Spiroplasma turonicum]
MILKNAKIVLENNIIIGWLEIENNIIKSINEGSTDLDGINLNENWILPGFIDCHVHGGYGVDFETGSLESYKLFSNKVVREGITSYVQGSVTNSLESNLMFMSEFKKFMNLNYKDGAKCLGIHLEGPFISPDKKGAHELSLLEKPNIQTLQKLIEASGNNIKIVTYAPDLQDGSFTKYMLENNIIPSVGHTNISFSDCERDYEIGFRHITHLFNGMSGVSQYEPGLAMFSLYKDDILCEVISDGIHINPDTLKFIYKVKGPNSICIITDAMNAKGLDDGEYKLGNLEVIKKGMKVSLKSSGVLAGAGATYDHNVRTFYSAIDNLSMTNLIKMTSINIAKQLNIFDKTGSIEVNKIADLVILDQNLNVKKTIVEGKILYESK